MTLCQLCQLCQLCRLSLVCAWTHFRQSAASFHFLLVKRLPSLAETQLVPYFSAVLQRFPPPAANRTGQRTGLSGRWTGTIGGRESSCFSTPSFLKLVVVAFTNTPPPKTRRLLVLPMMAVLVCTLHVLRTHWMCWLPNTSIISCYRPAGKYLRLEKDEKIRQIIKVENLKHLRSTERCRFEDRMGRGADTRRNECRYRCS